MKLITPTKTITNLEQAKTFLAKYNVLAERWQPDLPDSSSVDPLLQYHSQIEKLKKRFSYKSADIVELNPDTPNLDKILGAFVKEHYHTDDEVRFTVEGEGVFGINPLSEPTFEVLVEAGDLLLVPANTVHWFDLTEKKHIRCIRVFKDNPRWEAIYDLPKASLLNS